MRGAGSLAEMREEPKICAIPFDDATVHLFRCCERCRCGAGLDCRHGRCRNVGRSRARHRLT